MKAEFDIDTQEIAREIAQEVIRAIKPLMKNAVEDDNILDVKGLSEYLKVTHHWIYQQTHLGTLPCFKLGNQLRFRKKDIDRHLEGLKIPAIGQLRAIK